MLGGGGDQYPGGWGIWGENFVVNPVMKCKMYWKKKCAEFKDFIYVNKFSEYGTHQQICQNNFEDSPQI